MDKERELNSSKLAFKNASQKFSQLETRSMSIDNTASIKTKVNIQKELQKNNKKASPKRY